VVLGVGRLGRIKNFPLLVKAFARVLPSRDCRLVILGEGKHRARLLALAQKLGVDHAMDLPGFVHNPIAYMARAKLFVLSSRWEGFGNVLVEALACGTPAVSTDCPSGPSEILQNGRYGPLVPVDDEAALAEAMLECLAHPMDAGLLREAAAPYTLERSCDAYLRTFGLA
jgi:glycosyltransferase involved in cell wall biosynthesis